MTTLVDISHMAIPAGISHMTTQAYISHMTTLADISHIKTPKNLISSIFEHYNWVYFSSPKLWTQTVQTRQVKKGI